MARGADRAWIARINAYFGERCQVVWWGHREAAVRRVGAWTVPSDLLPDVERNRADLAARGKPNEIQALCVEPIDFSRDRLEIGYRTVDYATARAMRARKLSPGFGILSASSFLVSLEQRQMIIQKRGAGMDLNPGRLHGFAGAYSPGRALDDSDGDAQSLMRTARRELREETGLDLADMAPPHLVFFSDPRTTAFEMCLLGNRIRPEDLAKLTDTEEGGVFPIPMDELGELLSHDERWGPGGQCEVMAWLALGAPPFAPDENFAGLTARQTFEKLTAR